MNIYTISMVNKRMANDDVGLKLCQQHVIKLDFEIKAAIQVWGHMKFSGTHRKCIEYLTTFVPLIAEN